MHGGVGREDCDGRIFDDDLMDRWLVVREGGWRRAEGWWMMRECARTMSKTVWLKMLKQE